jgi:uncharacterized protein (DUF2267 family)
MSTLWAMPLAPDPHADADYRAFLETLAHAGLPRRTEAARATGAVACALALRLADPHFEPLREILLRPLQGRLAACERHRARPLRPFGRPEDFLEIVCEDLGGALDDAEAAARAVVHALRRQLPEEAEEEAARRLPADLLSLWTLAS